MRLRRPWVLGIVAMGGLAGLGAACGGSSGGAPHGDAGASAPDDASFDGSGSDAGGGALDAASEVATPDAGPVEAGLADGPSDSGIDAAPALCAVAPSSDAGAAITVSGHVFDWAGFPAVASVSIQGTTTTSAADGSFTIAGVAPPYGVVLDAGYGITSYIGLTRSDPSLLTPVGLDQVSAAQVQGTFVSASDAGTVFGAVLDLPGTPNGLSQGTTGQPFSLFANWAPGSPDASATLWGFQATPLSTGGIGTITALGPRSMTLQNGVNVTGMDLALSAAAPMQASTSTTSRLPTRARSRTGRSRAPRSVGPSSPSRRRRA
jgi:hypothetical protein